MKKYFFYIATFFFIFSKNSFAQTKNDIGLIKKANAISISNASISNAYFLKSVNPFSFAMKITLIFYQKVISVQWQTDCPHQPSCSNFAKQSIYKFGMLKGMALAADRLTRCSPFGIKNYRYWEYDSRTDKYPDPPSFYYLRQISKQK